MLYIQMEFCPRTLREVLDRGPLNADDSWQVISSTVRATGRISIWLTHADAPYISTPVLKLGGSAVYAVPMQVTRQLLAGLAHIHAQGIIHRVSSSSLILSYCVCLLHVSDIQTLSCTAPES